MSFKPSMIHYKLSLSNIFFLNIIPNEAKYIHQKKKKKKKKTKKKLLYNTFNIYENATLPLFIYTYLKIFEGVLNIM
jgi:hypothetical protein